MMWNEQTQQDARRLVESLTQKQWNAILYAFDVLTRPATKEEQAREQERLEKAQKAKEARIIDFEEKKSAFDAMAQKVRKNLSIPESYEWAVPEVHPLFEYVFHPMAGHDEIYTAANVMFDFGFKRGMACQKRRMEQKIQEDIKKAMHPSRINPIKQAIEKN